MDLPLLSHQRKAARTRQAAIGFVLVVTFGALIAGAVAYSSDRVVDVPAPNPEASPAAATAPTASAHDASTPPNPAQPTPGAPAGPDDLKAKDPSALTRTVRPFGKAAGFRDALERAGCTGEEARALVTAMDELVDFRRCRPEHRLVFERDSDGTLQAFEYIVSDIERYRAEQVEGSWNTRAIKAEVEVRRLRKGSHIAGSLGAALEAQGLGRSLAGVFVEAFEGKIDFYRDTREGDSFRIVVDEERANDQSLGYRTVHGMEYVGQRVGRLQAFWFKPYKEARGEFHDENGRALQGGWLRTPLRYDHISSKFDPRRRHPILKRIVPHTGVDYAASTGTLVWAAADGVVKFAGYRGANGNLVTIRHPGGWETAYAHLSRISRGIKAGARVRQRQTIGAVGSTGRSTGPHLHFGLKRNGRFIDPIDQLNGPGKPLPRKVMPQYKRTVKALQAELAEIRLATAPEEEPDDEPPAIDFHH